MTKTQLSEVVYKPDPHSTDEFIVIVNPDQYTSWRHGNTSIPLADVVECTSSSSLTHSLPRLPLRPGHPGPPRPGVQAAA